MVRKYGLWMLVILFVVSLAACSGGGGSGTGSAATGAVDLHLTDGPGDYDHVWITITGAWFHVSDGSEPNDAGWHRFPLPSPVTIDLLTLRNGVISDAIWKGLVLPAGHYQQIRIVLADTDDALTASAKAAGLKYNNEVVIGANEYPLSVPDAKNGLKLSGSFQVPEGGLLRLAIDFNVDEDIVEINKNNNPQFLFKPRLECFELDRAGAIVGSITVSSITPTPVSSVTTTADISTAKFVIKSEQVAADGTRYVVRRYTMPAADGTFTLYPLAPGTYDLVLRGLGYKTVIIRGVPVTKGEEEFEIVDHDGQKHGDTGREHCPNCSNNTSGTTTLPPIAMEKAAVPDHIVSGSIASPTGAWVNFYQELAVGTGAGYQIRFVHFNPFNGQFTNFALPADEILVGSYSGGVISALTATTPVGGSGSFTAIASALMYSPSTPQLVTASTNTISFGSLTVKSPATARSVSGQLIVSGPTKSVNQGILFAVNGGMVVNAISIDGLLSGGTPTNYIMNNLPGGSAAVPSPLGIYSIEAIAWSSVTPTAVAVSIPRTADLRTGDAANVNINLWQIGP
jgi:hypothetical protein